MTMIPAAPRELNLAAIEADLGKCDPLEVAKSINWRSEQWLAIDAGDVTFYALKAPGAGFIVCRELGQFERECRRYGGDGVEWMRIVGPRVPAATYCDDCKLSSGQQRATCLFCGSTNVRPAGEAVQL